jgi:hypothetical protein
MFEQIYLKIRFLHLAIVEKKFQRHFQLKTKVIQHQHKIDFLKREIEFIKSDSLEKIIA